MQVLMKAPARIEKFVPHSIDEAAGRKIGQPESAVPVLKTEHFDQLAHDARNTLSAMKLYCELLAEPGVLTPAHTHYAQELQAITDTVSRLVERLAAPRRTASRPSILAKAKQNLLQAKGPIIPQEIDISALGAEPWPGEVVGNLGAELKSMQPLLAAITGPHIELEMEVLPCEGRTRLSKENLTRIMLNLTRNASEAMPGGGKLRITGQYGGGLSFLDARQIPEGQPRTVLITIEDSGPGIPEELRERIFADGFTTREAAVTWPGIPRRGLGLTIVRDLIEEAAGCARACPSPGGGARIELELPVTSGMYEITDTCGLVADSAPKGCIECP